MPPERAPVSLSGKVTELFAHRFVVATPNGSRLADLGPKGAEAVRLSVGDEVRLTGEQKPSEIKVQTISVGGRDYEVRHGEKHEHGAGSPDVAIASVKAIGFEPVEPPKRKARHFEIVARRGEDALEFHIDLDGAIRKTKPARRAG